MMYFYRRFFIFVFIFVLFSAFFLQKKATHVQAGCYINCYADTCGKAKNNNVRACTSCDTVCLPDPPPPPPCVQIAVSCNTSCGQPNRCTSTGCGGQTCCPATADCPPAYTPVPPTPTPNPCLKQSQGDANCDGSINDADFLVFKSVIRGLGSTCTLCSADFNKDGKTSLVDYEIWRNSAYK